MYILLESVFPAVVPVFSIILIGFLIGRKTSYNLGFPTDITMYFTLPALVFSTLVHKWDTPFLAKTFLITGSGTAFIIFGTGILAMIYIKANKKEEAKSLYPTVMFIASGNFVLTLDYFAFGYEGFLRGIFFQMVNTSLMFTLGVYMVGGETSLRKIILTPFFVAAISGALIWVFHIKLPDVVLHSVDFLGKSALPLLLLMLGFSLSNIHISNMSLALAGGIMRIFGGLGVAIVFVLLLRFFDIISYSEDELLTIKLLVFNGGMPAAVGTFLLAQKYNRNPELVASSVFASTLIGLLTIPFVLWSVNYFIS